MVVSSFFQGVFDTSIIPPPPPNATAIRAGFGAFRAEKSPRGGRNSLGAWHFGVIFLAEDKRGAEGLQGCCLGQARLRTTSPSALTRCHCPGCGSQRLLRCRSHPAGRGPNSSSLFPPLAAVVAVAPSRGGFGSPRKVNGFARGSPTRGAVERSETERLY